MTYPDAESNRLPELPEPPSLIRPPRMSIPASLRSGQRSEAPATKIMHEIVRECDLLHDVDAAPHWVITCASGAVMKAMNVEAYDVLLRMHRARIWLHGVEDPYEGEKCSWDEVQEQSLALGGRVISLFQYEGQPFVAWTVFSSPGMASLRFLMHGIEFTYEHSQGYPAEVRFESVEFPLAG